MRHGDKQNNLGRKKAHRDALLSNLAAQLITHKRIVTTLAKAKELRKYVEPLITKTKKNASEAQISHNHRLVFSFLQNKTAVKELFTVVGPKIGDRPGGYTRIIKLGIRPGDNGEKAMIELVDFNEVYGKSAAAGENQEAAKRTRRSRSAAKKATDATTASAEPTTASAIEDVEVVEEKAPEAPVAESAPEAPATEAEAPKADDAAGESTEEAAK
jgi:large subunit ribosomal protein L17